MALLTGEGAPGNGYDLITQELARITGSEWYRKQFAIGDERRFEITRPFRSFSLSLEGATMGNPLSRTKLEGWRYLVIGEYQANSSAWISAEVKVDPVSERALGCVVSLGSSPREWNSFLISDEVRALTAAKDYELSMLRVRALGMRALWLRDQGPEAEDMFGPSALVQVGLLAVAETNVITKNSFLEALSAKARERLASGIRV